MDSRTAGSREAGWQQQPDQAVAGSTKKNAGKKNLSNIATNK